MKQVVRLVEMLFDACQPLHGLGQRERELLTCAALLHDIGLSVGVLSHHKHSQRLILEAALPALTDEERAIVANVARYHRKALPSEKHPPFAELSPRDREVVRHLAALLRVADGLDRAHEDAVEILTASPAGKDAWTLRIFGPGNLDLAAQGVLRKADLFEAAFGVKLRIMYE